MAYILHETSLQGSTVSSFVQHLGLPICFDEYNCYDFLQGVGRYPKRLTSLTVAYNLDSYQIIDWWYATRA